VHRSVQGVCFAKTEEFSLDRLLFRVSAKVKLLPDPESKKRALESFRFSCARTRAFRWPSSKREVSCSDRRFSVCHVVRGAR